jgi:hypothetical protein
MVDPSGDQVGEPAAENPVANTVLWEPSQSMMANCHRPFTRWTRAIRWPSGEIAGSPAPVPLLVRFVGSYIPPLCT